MVALDSSGGVVEEGWAIAASRTIRLNTGGRNFPGVAAELVKPTVAGSRPERALSSVRDDLISSRIEQ